LLARSSWTSGAQLRVLDVDQLQRLLGDGRGLGRHRRDLVADAAHRADLERQLVVREAEGVLLDVGAGDDRQHARQRDGAPGVDPHQPRVRVARAEDLAVDQPRQVEVVQEARAPGDLVGPVALGDAGADDARALRHASEPTRSRSWSIAMTSSAVAPANRRNTGVSWNAKKSRSPRSIASSFDSPGLGARIAPTTRSLW
jgi:hypothetical protein